MRENKTPVIGIARALFYWKEPFFWEDLFRALGFNVVMSPVTNKEIVEKGVKTSDPETCFSVKVFFGHLAYLDENQEVNFIFIPRYITDEEQKEYCLKFFGLPDIAKIIFKKAIISPTFNERRGKKIKQIEKFCFFLVKRYGIKVDVKNEIKKAIERQKQREKEKSEKFFKKICSSKKKIILVSHPYNLYDEYVNVRIEKKLKKLGGEVIFIDEAVLKADGALDSKFHWEFCKKILGQIDSMKHENVDGAIFVTSFQCGCDAVLKEFVEEKFKSKGTPFFSLIIDEHTGEAGVQTRIEAFWDTL